MEKFRIGTPMGGILLGCMGALLALLLLFLGFWRTLLVTAFFAVGYFLGAVEHKSEVLKAWINKHFPPKDE